MTVLTHSVIRLSSIAMFVLTNWNSEHIPNIDEIIVKTENDDRAVEKQKIHWMI